MICKYIYFIVLSLSSLIKAICISYHVPLVYESYVDMWAISKDRRPNDDVDRSIQDLTYHFIDV